MTTKREYRKRFNEQPEPIAVSELGKLPPQAVDLEESVLGAILLEAEAYHEIADIIFPEAFYKEQNQLVCAAVLNLVNEGKPVDILTVTEELRRTGNLQKAGGAHHIADLTSRLGSSANIEYHMRIVLQKYVAREVIRSCFERIREAYDETADEFDVLDNYERDLNTITNSLHVTKSSDMATLLQQVVEENKVLRSKRGTIIGITTGFTDLDVLTGGWQDTDLIILAARPGMGKSALVLHFATAAAKSKQPVALFSLEMSAIQMMKRICSQETDIPLDMIIRQGMDDPTLNRFNLSVEGIKKAPLYIDDTPALKLSQLRRKARKLKREKKIRMIVIDYLQLMSGETDGGNREQEVGKISRGLKALAKELEIPIIALSQLSRATEDRTKSADHMPKLSHLRDSGAIEQDADMVIFIYRPEYYGIEVDNENQSTKGRAQIIIAKNRHGALDTVELKWIGTCVKFVDKHSASKELEPNTAFL